MAHVVCDAQLAAISHMFNKYPFIMSFHSSGARLLPVISMVPFLSPFRIEPPTPKLHNPTKKHFLIKPLFIYLIDI